MLPIETGNQRNCANRRGFINDATNIFLNNAILDNGRKMFKCLNPLCSNVFHINYYNFLHFEFSHMNT